MDGQAPKIWKLVLTGGPCGGKTTGQSRLSTFFENIGWKVFRVPETANLLLSGGVDFSQLSHDAAVKFQENLLKAMLHVENCFFDLAQASGKNCLVICDRGAMDASAFISRQHWELILARNSLHELDLRDKRYNQVIHLMSAARGAENFYSTEHHSSRHESIGEARDLDLKAAEAWVGHPYVDILDNSHDFETKINLLISKVAWSVGIDVGDRLHTGARKFKFLVKGPLPDAACFPVFRDFEVCHHYLQSNSRTVQSRLRKRGDRGKCTYTHTVRKHLAGQTIEVKTPLGHREYFNLLSQADPTHFQVYKTRRCFLYRNQYFQLDIYREPFHERCRGIMLLETYSTVAADRLRAQLPEFLQIGMDVTGDPAFSMFNLSLRDDWANNNKFCHRLVSEDEVAVDECLHSVCLEAQDRLAKSTDQRST